MKLINTIGVMCTAAVLASSFSVTPTLQSEQVRTMEATTSAHDVALAAQAIYLNGLFGSSIDWRSVTNNGVQVCGPKCPNMAYTALPTQWGLKSGVDLLYKWVTDPARTAGDTVNAYSLGTDVALGVLRQLAAEGKTIPKMQWWLIASPETQGTRATVVGYKGVEGLPAGQFDNVAFVVAKYDLFADPAARFGILSFMNAVLTTHLFGYNGLDLSKPDYIHVDPITGATTLVFKEKVLPILQLASLFFDKKTIAAWTAVLEPLIDADYDRDWQKVQTTAVTAEVSMVPAGVNIDAKVSSDDQGEPNVDVAPKQETAEASDGGINKQAEVAETPETPQVTDEDATVDPQHESEVTSDEATQETAAPTKPDTEDADTTDPEVKDADKSDGQQADGEDASEDDKAADKESTDEANDKSTKTEDTDTAKDDSDSKRETAESKDDSGSAKAVTKDTSSSATSGSKNSDGGE